MADINRNEEKVPAPEEIHGLAAALDQFGADFDPYEYMDTVEDKEQNIRDTEAMLLAGKTDGLKNYLLGFIDDDRDPQAVQAAQELMKRLEEILPQLGARAQCATARAEEAAAVRRERYDYAVSRAVARLNILLELTAPYVKVGGAVLAMKGSAAREELAECTSAIKKLGLQLESVKEFSIDGASPAVIVLRKTAPTPKQYPRRYAKIKQSPL